MTTEIGFFASIYCFDTVLVLIHRMASRANNILGEILAWLVVRGQYRILLSTPVKATIKMNENSMFIADSI